MIRDLLPSLLVVLAEGLKGHCLLLAIVFIGYQLMKRAIRYYRSPLRHQGIPGPFLAGFSCWYRVFYADVRRNWHAKLVELHGEYGPIVWIAPDEVSISDPLLRGSIYPFADNRKEKSFFAKSKSFETGLFNDDFNFVFETDAAKARLGKYALSHPYSEKVLAKLENNFDEVCTKNPCSLLSRLLISLRLLKDSHRDSLSMLQMVAWSTTSRHGVITSCSTSPRL